MRLTRFLEDICKEDFENFVSRLYGEFDLLCGLKGND